MREIGKEAGKQGRKLGTSERKKKFGRQRDKRQQMWEMEKIDKNGIRNFRGDKQENAARHH